MTTAAPTLEDRVAETLPLLRMMAWERASNQPWLLDDMVQEATIRVWQRLADDHPKAIALHAGKQAMIDVLRGRRMTGSNVGTTGKTDTAHRARPLIRTSSVGEEYLDEPADESAAERLAQIDLALALAPALASLPEAQRDLVRGYFFEGLDQAALAERAGVTRQAISLRLKKALAALRPQVEGIL